MHGLPLGEGVVAGTEPCFLKQHEHLAEIYFICSIFYIYRREKGREFLCNQMLHPIARLQQIAARGPSQIYSNPYPLHEQAAKAIANRNGQTPLGFSRPLRCTWAAEKTKPAAGTVPPPPAPYGNVYPPGPPGGYGGPPGGYPPYGAPPYGGFPSGEAQNHCHGPACRRHGIICVAESREMLRTQGRGGFYLSCTLR